MFWGDNLLYSALHWVVSSVALLITANVVRGFKVKGFTSALVAAAVIGLANIVIWPFLIFLTLPINILTLGLFTFVVNGAVLKICAGILPGFEIDSWLSAIFGSIILSLIGTGLHYWLV
ncbi:MAG: phage holin family protein [Bdellovibrionota bacterium]